MILLEGTLGSLVGTIVLAGANAGGVGFSLLLYLVAGLAAVATIAGVVFGVKWKTNAAVAHNLALLNGEYAATLEKERDNARDSLEEARKTIAAAQQTIARLEALPNLERVLELVGKTFHQLGDRFDEHEKRAGVRHDELVQALRKAAA